MENWRILSQNYSQILFLNKSPGNSVIKSSIFRRLSVKIGFGILFVIVKSTIQYYSKPIAPGKALLSTESINIFLIFP